MNSEICVCFKCICQFGVDVVECDGQYYCCVVCVSGYFQGELCCDVDCFCGGIIWFQVVEDCQLDDVLKEIFFVSDLILF